MLRKRAVPVRADIIALAAAVLFMGATPLMAQPGGGGGGLEEGPFIPTQSTVLDGFVSVVGPSGNVPDFVDLYSVGTAINGTGVAETFVHVIEVADAFDDSLEFAQSYPVTIPGGFQYPNWTIEPPAIHLDPGNYVITSRMGYVNGVNGFTEFHSQSSMITVN